MSILPSALTLYSWIGVGALIYLLIRIARFYQQKYTELRAELRAELRVEGKDPTDPPKPRMYSALFLAPLYCALALFLFSAGRYAWHGDLAGDIPSDLALAAGGAVLVVSSYHFYRLLTRRRRG
jgi:hypothetical protein